MVSVAASAGRMGISWIAKIAFQSRWGPRWRRGRYIARRKVMILLRWV